MGCKLIDCFSSSGRETLLTERPLIKLQRRKRDKEFCQSFYRGEGAREREREQKEITHYHKKKKSTLSINVKVEQCCQLTVLHWSLEGRHVGPPAETQQHAVLE